MLAHDNCIFCQMAQKKREIVLIAQFEHCFVIEDQYPISPGHLLIIPYQHAKHWFAAPHEVKNEMIAILDELKRLLDKEYYPDGYNIGLNCRKAAGQTVMHLHMHLIPRYNENMEDPRGGIRGVIPSKQKY